MTHYDTLGVIPTADPDIIHAAYRALAKKYHPDNQETGNAKKFRQIETAHKTLKDPAQRAAYDAILVAPKRKRANTHERNVSPEAAYPPPYRQAYQDPRFPNPEEYLRGYAASVVDRTIDELLGRFRR